MKNLLSTITPEHNFTSAIREIKQNPQIQSCLHAAVSIFLWLRPCFLASIPNWTQCMSRLPTIAYDSAIMVGWGPAKLLLTTADKAWTAHVAQCYPQIRLHLTSFFCYSLMMYLPNQLIRFVNSIVSIIGFSGSLLLKNKCQLKAQPESVGHLPQIRKNITPTYTLLQQYTPYLFDYRSTFFQWTHCRKICGDSIAIKGSTLPCTSFYLFNCNM